VWLGTLGIAVPNFVWGLLLIVVFGAILQLLPVSGRVAPEYEAAEMTGSAVVDVLLRRDPRRWPEPRAPAASSTALALPLPGVTHHSLDLLELGEEYVVTERMKASGRRDPSGGCSATRSFRPPPWSASSSAS
jgi:peptide/nickel transport system permease protein